MSSYSLFPAYSLFTALPSCPLHPVIISFFVILSFSLSCNSCDFQTTPFSLEHDALQCSRLYNDKRRQLPTKLFYNLQDFIATLHLMKNIFRGMLFRDYYSYYFDHFLLIRKKRPHHMMWSPSLLFLLQKTCADNYHLSPAAEADTDNYHLSPAVDAMISMVPVRSTLPVPAGRSM